MIRKICFRNIRTVCLEAVISVYELLGAEVYLYFEVNGVNMTARVKPTTEARTGDSVRFALMWKKSMCFDKETELVITN